MMGWRGSSGFATVIVCVVTVPLRAQSGTPPSRIVDVDGGAMRVWIAGMEHRQTGRPASQRMPDGKQWMTSNLDVDAPGSYCYEDAEENCRRYGRLYTWDSAQRGCRQLGEGWRLPTNDEWRQMAKHYGGVSDDSADKGKAAYAALSIGGNSGFNALLGGGRELVDDRYARLDAHGFYWTATESTPASAWFYNFAKGGLALHPQRGGEKQLAFSVRCIKE